MHYTTGMIGLRTPLSQRVVLGVTGGIAAYKAAELTRLFVKAGIAWTSCMTEAACRFVTPLTLQALSGQPVLTDMWEIRRRQGMAHIELSRGADAIVVAPASADFLAKVAQRPRRRPALHAVRSRANARCSSRRR